MDYTKEYSRMIQEARFLTIGSSKNEVPNVRIVNFYTSDDEKTLYFSTMIGSEKTAEFATNSKVAFMTVPDFTKEPEFVKSNNATIKKSDMSVQDFRPGCVKKYPEMAGMLDNMGHMMEVWEIHIHEARVTVGMGNDGKVTF